MRVEIRTADFPFAKPFRIAYRARTSVATVVVELHDADCTGRGEASGVSYHGETQESLRKQLIAVKTHLEGGATRADLQRLLPPGGARNAIDCAFWDLEAKRARVRAWELAGFASVRSLVTAYTLSIDTPEAMAAAADGVRKYSLLKLKLAGDNDLERVTAVRAARPDCELIVDANQAWTARQLREFAPRLAELGVKLLEQPLPVGQDDLLLHFNSPVPLCADESCQDSGSLPELAGKYQYINIKLDKTGGLTQALELARVAQQLNFKLMVGCMAGSSLSMAPAFIVGQLCSIVDLDGPLLATADVADPIRYDGSRMFAPTTELWG